MAGVVFESLTSALHSTVICDHYFDSTTIHIDIGLIIRASDKFFHLPPQRCSTSDALILVNHLYTALLSKNGARDPNTKD